MLAKQLRCDQERTRFVISAVISGVIWAVLVVGTIGIGLIYAGFISLFVLIAHALLLAHMRGNGLRLSEQQLPDLYAKVVRAANILGLKEIPDVYVTESGGVLNAFATKLLSRRYVILYSNLLDACEAAGDQRGAAELDFIIGHELGHLAAGHLSWNTFLLPSKLVPWLGPAYSRAREYTCDACGHAVVNDLGVSSRALVLLAAGGRNAARVNLDAFVDQRREAAGFWMAVYELNASHPFLSKRVAALRERANPGSAKAEPRSALAYLTAPMFGLYAPGGSAPALAIVVAIGVMAALGMNALRDKMGALAMMNQAMLAQPNIDPADLGTDETNDVEEVEPLDGDESREPGQRGEPE